MAITTLYLVEIERDVIADSVGTMLGALPRQPGWYVCDQDGWLTLGPYPDNDQAAEAARATLDFPDQR